MLHTTLQRALGSLTEVHLDSRIQGGSATYMFEYVWDICYLRIKWQRKKANLLSVNDPKDNLSLDNQFLKKGAMTSRDISSNWGQQRTTQSGFLILLKWASELGAYKEYTPVLKDRQNKISSGPHSRLWDPLSGALFNHLNFI